MLNCLFHSAVLLILLLELKEFPCVIRDPCNIMDLYRLYYHYMSRKGDVCLAGWQNCGGSVLQKNYQVLLEWIFAHIYHLT